MPRQKVETKAYEKKYKDKSTGEWKSLSISLARVGDRLLKYIEDHPNCKLISKHVFESNGTTTMKVFLWKDKKDAVYQEGKLILDSADTTGTANDITVRSSSSGLLIENKALEKLETVATGRALANAGYMKDGEIASTEEMQEFEEWKEQQAQERKLKIEEIVLDIKATATIEKLKEYFTNLTPEFKNEGSVQKVKNKRYKELNNATQTKTK